MDSDNLAWPAFRASLISPLLTGEISAGDRGAYFCEVAGKEHVLPSGRRGRISVRTLWRWYRKMRVVGWQGMVQAPRSDRGQARQRLQERIARAVALKREQPLRSHRVINTIVRREFGEGIPKTTLYRHLRMHGATRRQLGVAKEKVRCRWTRDYPNALWQGDFEHGPTVLINGQARQTRLTAWIDSYSRFILSGRYYPYENTDTLIDSLLRAWTVHGSSTEIYVDNGKVYHSKALTVACAQLQIRKLHRPPREPQPGGLIERFFQTVQSQFESEVRVCRTITLTELNEHFSNWLKVDYHQTAHSDTRQRGAHQQQPTLPPPQKLEESAYFRALQAETQKQQQSERQDGIDFHSAMAHGRLTLTGLCQCVARLLGHKGGLSEFTAEELHALQRLHQDHPHLLQSHVRTAFERVTSADFTSVLWELQQLLADTKGTDGCPISIISV